MFKPRLSLPVTGHCDPDGVKLYMISAKGVPVDHRTYVERLAVVKREKRIDSATAAFAIFHDGAALQYLVVGWWGNENELFVSVSIGGAGGWVEDREKYSFCVWDLELMWHERNSFIRHMYSGMRDLDAYRRDLKGAQST